MNTTKYFRPRSGAARIFSWITAFVLVFSLLAFPARATSAPSGALSAELVFSSEGMDISGKLALDINQQLLAAVAGVGTNGVTLADLGAYLSGQAAAAGGSMIGGTYGVDFATLVRNLPKSIFAPDSGSSYALDEETYNQILALMNRGLGPAARFGSFGADVSSDELAQDFAVLQEAYSGIGEVLVSCLNLDVNSTSLVINNKPIQVLQGSVTIDGEAFAAIVNALITPLQGNTEAQEALATIIDGINAASDEELGFTGEEAVEMIVSQLPGMLPEMAQELDAAGFSARLILCISNDTPFPVKFGMELQADGETVELNLLISEEMDFYRFELKEDGAVTTYMQLDITENTADTLAFKFTVQNEYEEPVSLDFNLNKAGKAFLVTVTADGETNSLSGYYSSSDTLFSITVDKANGQNLGGTMTLNLRSDDSISMPTFSEITTMTEEEFTTLVNQIGAAFDMFSQMAA